MRKYLKNEAVYKACHILRMLDEQAELPHRSFHTPGHKVSGYDITELDYSDNLSCPQGVLLQAENDLAKILGAEKSFLLTDGSTSGVLSMLYALKMQGVKRIAAPVLSHKSFFNGCALLGLMPCLFETPTDALPKPLSAKDVEEALQNADALFLTSPDYYGNVAKWSEIAELCRAQNKPLVVDGAHGGHLHYNKELHAGAYADAWVDGVHKSLPAFTQGAVVSARGTFAEFLKTAVDTFRTTSPSYPIMASVEYAVKYPENERLRLAVEAWKAGKEYIYQNDDYTKLCVFVKDGFKAEKLAHEVGIYPEFSQENVLCFYFSPVQGLEDLSCVDEFVKTLQKSGMLLAQKEIECVHAPAVFEKIDGKPTEKVALEKSVGRVCATVCGLFPPCLPLLKKGEVITLEKVQAIKAAPNKFGVENNMILVVAK